MAMVLDASAVVYAVTQRTERAREVRGRIRAEVCHAPHLVDAEVGNVLRRMISRGSVAPDHAAVVINEMPSFIDHRYAHTGALARAAWSLRDNITFYDALYVALAAALGVPLLTADRKLASAPSLPCAIEIV